MATRWAVASGNWSNSAIWNGGTLPTANDDVYADGYAVTINQTATVNSIRTTQRSGGTVGGSFSLNAGVTFTATNPMASGGGLMGGVSDQYCLTYPASSGSSTLIANVSEQQNSSFNALAVTSSGILSVVGDVRSQGHGYGINISGPANVSILGSVYGATIATIGGGGWSGNGLYVGASATVSITGNITSGVGHANAFGVRLAAPGSTLNVVGAVSAQFTNAIYSDVAHNLVIAGLMSASSSAPALYSSHDAAINRCSGPFINNAGVMAVYAKRLFISAAASTRWEFTTEAFTPRNLYSADTVGGNPAVSNVRHGTAFGPSGELTGTCYVPAAGTVVLGVPVDHTVGAVSLAPDAIIEALQGTLTGIDNTLASMDGTLTVLEDRLEEQVPTGPVVIAPSPGNGQTTAVVVCYDAAGALAEGVRIYIELASSTASGAYAADPVMLVSNAEGLAAGPIPRGDGHRFRARRGMTGKWVPFAGVDADRLDLPAILGDP